MSEAQDDVKPCEAEPMANATRRRGPPKNFRKPKGAAQREQLCDLDAASKELTEARRELAAIPNGLTRYQRAAYLSEPLSRLSLVARFINGVLEKNNWEPAALEGA